MIGAVRLLTAEFERASAAQDKLKADEGGISRLAQFKGTKAEHRQIVNAARSIYGTGGSNTFGEAGGLAFELFSGGFLKEWKFASEMFKIDDIETLAAAAGTVRLNLGLEEVGSFENLVSKALAGANVAPRANASDILAGIATASSAGAKLGLDDEQIGAAITTAMQRSAPAVATTQIDALFSRLAKLGFGEGPLRGDLGAMIDNISKLNLSENELQELLANKRAVVGFDVINKIITDPKNPSSYPANLRGQISSNDVSFGRQAIIRRLGIPEIAATRIRRAAEAREEMSLSIQTIRLNKGEAALSEFRQYRKEQGDLPVAVDFGSAIGGLALKYAEASPEQSENISSLPSEIANAGRLGLLGLGYSVIFGEIGDTLKDIRNNTASDRVQQEQLLEIKRLRQIAESDISDEVIPQDQFSPTGYDPITRRPFLVIPPKEAPLTASSWLKPNIDLMPTE